MSLTSDERLIIRQAICDGFYSLNNLNSARVTVDILTSISQKSDGDLRADIASYKTAKINRLTSSIDSLVSQQATLQAQKDALS